MTNAAYRSGVLYGFMLESINTHTASPWELLKARLFGKRRTYPDIGFAVTVSEYRGKVYLLKISEDHPHD